MEQELIHGVAALRATVGFLGERHQAGWWTSTFFASGSTAFLAPAFPRTQILAQCTAVTRAAALVHDERIGVGQHVYHLFRLPEDVEQRLHVALHEPELVRSVTELVASRENAVQHIRARSQAGNAGSGLGPSRIGNISDLRIPERWSDVAAQYLRAVDSAVEIYPYFADRA